MWRPTKSISRRTTQINTQHPCSMSLSSIETHRQKTYRIPRICLSRTWEARIFLCLIRRSGKEALEHLNQRTWLGWSIILIKLILLPKLALKLPLTVIYLKHICSAMSIMGLNKLKQGITALKPLWDHRLTRWAVWKIKIIALSIMNHKAAL